MENILLEAVQLTDDEDSSFEKDKFTVEELEAVQEFVDSLDNIIE